MQNNWTEVTQERARYLYRTIGRTSALSVPSPLYSALSPEDKELHAAAMYAVSQASNERFAGGGNYEGATLQIGVQGIWREIDGIYIDEETPSARIWSDKTIYDVVYVLVDSATGSKSTVTTSLTYNDQTKAWLDEKPRAKRSELIKDEGLPSRQNIAKLIGAGNLPVAAPAA